MNIAIRPASPADLPRLLEFEQGVIAAERPFARNLKDGSVTYYDIEQLISDAAAELLVAEHNGTVIGCAYARITASKPHFKQRFFAYLGFMYIEPQYRGMAINKRLIEALMDWSKSRGVYELSLEVYCENAAAISAYKKAGFSENTMEMRIELEQ